LRCLEAGMNEYMSKPFEFADFYHRVGKILLKTGEAPPASIHAKTTGVFDLSLLGEAGDDEYVRDIVQTFVDGLPAQLAELEAAASLVNPEQLYHIAHRLRGSTGMLQAVALWDRLGRLERLAKEKADGRSLVEELLPLFDLLRSELLNYLTIKKVTHEYTRCGR
jgi:HPt (histidine-containing phosphotransfer) domain-containing protein